MPRGGRQRLSDTQLPGGGGSHSYSRANPAARTTGALRKFVLLSLLREMRLFQVSQVCKRVGGGCLWQRHIFYRNYVSHLNFNIKREKKMLNPEDLQAEVV